MSADALAAAFTAAQQPVRYAGDKQTVESLLANVRVDPHDGLNHAVLADALEEQHGGPHPIIDWIRKHGVENGGESQNLWHDAFDNSFDGTFPGELHVGDWHQFRLLLGREGLPGQPNERWHLRVNPHRVRNRQLRDVAYVIEMTPAEAQKFADDAELPAMKRWVTPAAGVTDPRMTGFTFDDAARDAENGRRSGGASQMQRRADAFAAAAQPVRYALATAFAAAQPVQYAKKTTTEAMIADALKRQRSGDNSWPIVADHLEESGLADQKTLDTLRSATGPLLLHRNAEGQYVATPKLTVSDLRRINRENGGHYFSPETMRFFGTRMEKKVHHGPGGIFFVHSGDNFDRTARQWHVTRFHPETGMTDGHVHRSGDPNVDLNAVPFGELIPLPDDLPSAAEAHAIAAHLAQHGVPPEHREQPEQMQRQSQPVKYAKQKRNRVHPLLRNTRLAVVLKEIAADKSRPQTAAFAKGILYDEHGPTRFAQFHDHLMDTEHPLLEHYNWPAVSEKLLHDAAAVDAVKTIARNSRRDTRSLGIADARTLLDHANGILGTAISRRYDGDRHREVIAARIRRDFPHASDAHVDESIRRVHHRVIRRAVRTPDNTHADLHRQVEREAALRPLDEQTAVIDRVYAGHEGRFHEDAKAQEKALRYDRVRVGGVKNALRLMQSQNQKQYHAIVGQVLTKLGLKPAKLRDGVTLSGAPISSVVVAIYHDGNPAVAEAAAAYFGHLAQLPSVTAFHAAADGPDSVYRLSLPIAPAAAAQHLQRHGIGRAVLIPNGSRTDVVVHDPGRRQADRVAAAAEGGEVQETVGTSVRLGHADGHRADAAARKSYRSVISQFEAATNAGNQQPAADGDGASPRAAADSAAATAAAG